MKPHENSV